MSNNIIDINVAHPNSKRTVSLAEANPELAMQWHPSKNYPLTPNNVTGGSAKKIWWLGPCGHEWQAKITSRNRGTGCPYCTRRTLLIGFNDLATTHPELAKEWHPTNNGSLQPTDILSGSSRKVWWQCSKCHHEWRANVYLRARGRGCARCCRQQTSFNEQALFYYTKQMCPDAQNRVKIAGKEADIWIPSLHVVEEYDGWRHNDAQIQADISKAKHMQENGMYFLRIREPVCPVLPQGIGEVFVLPSLNNNDIEVAILWTLQQLQLLDASLVIPSVDIKRDEVVIQAQLARDKKERSLGYLHPELCREWDWELNGTLTPYMVAPCSERTVFWKCPNGHSYSTTPQNRIRAQNSCPYCNRHSMVTGYNDLATVRPELAKYWHPTKNGDLTPQQVPANSTKQVWWLCDCGYEYYRSPHKQRHGQCNACYRHQVHSGVNDLATTHPQHLEAWCVELNDISPTQVTAENHCSVAWKCPNGHIHYKTVAKYIKNPACPHCDMQRSHSKMQRKRCVVRYTDNTTQQYASAQEAAMAIGCSVTTIRNYCNQKYAAPNNEQWSWVT